MNLLEQQAANRRRTFLVMIAFVLFLAVIGGGVDFFLIGGGQFYLPIATTGAVGIGFFSSLITYFHGDKAILASSRAQPVDRTLASATNDDDRLRYQQFKNIVEEVAIAAGLPAPRRQVRSDGRRHDLEVTLPDGMVLVLEIDGPTHDSPESRWADASRDAGVAAVGKLQVRIPAFAVRHQQLEVVTRLVAIRRAAEARAAETWRVRA